MGPFMLLLASLRVRPRPLAHLPPPWKRFCCESPGSAVVCVHVCLLFTFVKCCCSRNGAKVNGRDASQWTPLHDAANNGSLEVQRLQAQRHMHI